MSKLSDLGVKTLSPTEKERWIADDNGLYLRLRAGRNPKFWFFRYSKGRKGRKLQIGPYPTVSLSQARKMALRMALELAQGMDPIAERDRREKTAKAEELAIQSKASRETVKSLFERWERVELKTRKDGGKEVRRAFSRDVFPAIGTVFVEELTRAQILRVVDGVLERKANRMAKVIFSLLRQMLRFAVDRGVINADPTSGVKKSKIGGKSVERERTLSDEEILSLQSKLPKSGLKPESQIAIWLALSTSCRIGELIKARWSDIDLNKHTWFIPAANSKNGKPHTVFLSRFASEQLMKLKALQTEDNQAQLVPRLATPWLFPNRTGTNHLHDKAISKQVCDRQKSGPILLAKRVGAHACRSLCLPQGKWGLHDLRRTGATLMVSLGVLPEVAERCLNHTEQSRIRRIYQRHGYENEMKAAWETLGCYLSTVLSQNQSTTKPEVLVA